MHVCDIRLDLRKPDWDRPPVRVMRGDADATVVRAHILDGGEPADLSHAHVGARGGGGEARRRG